MKKCTYCDELNEEYEELCHNCGAPFAGIDKSAVARKPDVMPIIEIVHDDGAERPDKKEEDVFTEEELVRETDTTGKGLMVTGFIIAIIAFQFVLLLSMFGFSTYNEDFTSIGVGVLGFIPATLSIMSLIFGLISLRRVKSAKGAAICTVIFSGISLLLYTIFFVSCVVQSMSITL